MTDRKVTRRLAAILAADIVGYSAMMGEDETGTLAALKSVWDDIFNPQVAEHDGRIVKMLGDGALVEFASVVDAVNCAVGVQRAMAAHRQNANLPVDLRVGVNQGDIIIEGDDIFGDAAALSGEPGDDFLDVSRSASFAFAPSFVLISFGDPWPPSSR